MKTNLGIVIVNWNSGKELELCLESIESAGYSENVLVVDNGSEEKLKVKSKKLKVKVIENGENLGYGGGNNVGIKYLLDKKVKYILILNPDTEIYKDTIPNLIKVMEGDEMIGIVGPKIYSDSSTPGESLRDAPFGASLRNTPGVSLPLIWSAGGVIDKNRFSAGLIGNGEFDKDLSQRLKSRGYEVDFISGTAMLVRAEVFERIGFLEKSYFMYYEDVEFCLKAKKAGFKVMFVPASKIMHHESSTIGKNSPSQAYYMVRNHLLFAERNAPIAVKIREFIRLPKTIYEHWQRKEYYALLGIRNYFMRRFGHRNF